MGLPCTHELQQRFQVNQPVYLSLAHPHWLMHAFGRTAASAPHQPLLLNSTSISEEVDEEDNELNVLPPTSEELRGSASNAEDGGSASKDGLLNEAHRNAPSPNSIQLEPQ
jgi:hypothetical protein